VHFLHTLLQTVDRLAYLNTSDAKLVDRLCVVCVEMVYNSGHCECIEIVKT